MAVVRGDDDDDDDDDGGQRRRRLWGAEAVGCWVGRRGPPRRPASEPTSLTAHSVLLVALYNGTIKRRGMHGVRR